MESKQSRSFFDYSSFEDYKLWRLFVKVFPIVSILAFLTLSGLFIAGLVIDSQEFGRKFDVNTFTSTIDVFDSDSFSVMSFVPVKSYSIQSFPLIIHYSSMRVHDFDYEEVYSTGYFFAKHGVAFIAVEAPFCYESKAASNISRNIRAVVDYINENFPEVNSRRVTVMSNELMAYLVLNAEQELSFNVKAYVLIDPPSTYHMANHPHGYAHFDSVPLYQYHSYIAPRSPDYEVDLDQIKMRSEKFIENFKNHLVDSKWDAGQLHHRVTSPVYIVFSTRCPFFYSLNSLYKFLVTTSEKVKVLAGPWEHDTWPEESDDQWAVNSRGDIAQFAKQFTVGTDLGFMNEMDWVTYHNGSKNYAYSTIVSKDINSHQDFYLINNALINYQVPSERKVRIPVKMERYYHRLEIMSPLRVKVNPECIWSTQKFDENFVLDGESFITIKDPVITSRVKSYFTVVLLHHSSDTNHSIILNKRIFSASDVGSPISLGVSSWTFKKHDSIRLAIFPAAPPDIWYTSYDQEGYLEFKESNVILSLATPSRSANHFSIPLKYPLDSKYTAEEDVPFDYDTYEHVYHAHFKGVKQWGVVNSHYYSVDEKIFGRVESDYWDISNSNNSSDEQQPIVNLVGQMDLIELVITEYSTSDSGNLLTISQIVDCMESAYKPYVRQHDHDHDHDHVHDHDHKKALPGNYYAKKGYIMRSTFTAKGQSEDISLDGSYVILDLSDAQANCSSIGFTLKIE